MARLPNVGGDDGNWGDILNDFLSQSHDDAGNLKPNSVDSDALSPNSVTAAAIANGSVVETLLAPAVVTKLNAVGSGVIADGAVTTVKLQDTAVTTAKITDGAITSAKIAGGTFATVATTGAYTDLTGKPTIPNAQVSSDWNASSGAAQILNKPTIPTLVDATNTAKGVIQLGGDLGGTAAIPTVPGLAGKANQSDLTALITTVSGKANTSSLAPIATTGSYSDLTGKPTIPVTAADVGAEPAGLSTATQTAIGSTLANYLTRGTSLLDAPLAPLMRFSPTTPDLPSLPATPPKGVLEATTFHNATAANPSQLVGSGIQSFVDYGNPANGGSTGIAGTAQAFTGLIDVKNSSSDSNEHAVSMGWLRYAAGAKGRAWFTDYSLHGPIGTQPGLLTGINMFINQYYNGSPIAGPAAGQWIITKPGQGGGRESGHESAPTYKIDVGLGIVGFAGTPGVHTRGYEVGLQIGGYGSGWMLSGESSLIGTGISIKDTQDQAITIAPTGAAGAIVWGGAVKVSPVAADGLQILSSSAHKLGLYGKTPVAQAAAIASPTADVASLKIAVDDLRTALKNIGITA